MKIDIVTLFPEMFAGVFEASIIGRAREKGLLEINLHNLRDWAIDKHKTVDDTPYGGGAGMVIKVEVMDRCLTDLLSSSSRNPPRAELRHRGSRINKSKLQITNYKLREKNNEAKSKTQVLKTILMTPQGRTFDQKKAREMAKLDHIVLICGHYEGFDQRIHDYLVDEELSIGDFVLTGGEIPAMAVVDAVARLVPGVIKEESHMNESFSVVPPQPPQSALSGLPGPSLEKEGCKKKEKSDGSPHHTATPSLIKRELRRAAPTRTGGNSHHPESVCDLSTPPLVHPKNCFTISGDPEAGGEYRQDLYLEYPHYTKPAEYKGWKVPEVLMSGNHAEIEKWRQKNIKKKP